MPGPPSAARTDHLMTMNVPAGEPSRIQRGASQSIPPAIEEHGCKSLPGVEIVAMAHCRATAGRTSTMNSRYSALDPAQAGRDRSRDRHCVHIFPVLESGRSRTCLFRSLTAGPGCSGCELSTRSSPSMSCREDWLGKRLRRAIRLAGALAGASSRTSSRVDTAGIGHDPLFNLARPVSFLPPSAK